MDPKASRVLELLNEKYPQVSAPSRGDPFRTLIGCILSHRTRDDNAERAANTLFSRVSTPGDIMELHIEELHDLIRCSGFYRQKARYIKETCRELMELHDGHVPNEKEKLLALPGVGLKTADIVLSHCFGEETIPVDVHVSRVSRRLGLAPMHGDPDEVQRSLHSLIPRNKCRLYDRSIIRLGKEYCRKTKPLCSECPLRECCEYSKPSRGI